jgi:GNAT superfamily N-acetyltransferase
LTPVDEQDKLDGRVIIRPPQGIELRICRMLLPEISGPAGVVWYRVAVDRESSQLIGAVGVREDFTQAARWIVDVHVIPPFRGRGFGRQLVESTAIEAARRGVGALDAWVLPEDGSERVQQIQKFGFRVYKKIFEFETSAPQILAAAQSVYKRVVERGSIPASARLISLKDADMSAVIALHTTYLGGTADGLLPRMGGGSLLPFEPHLSQVLLLDDRVMGLALGHLRADPKIYEFDALVIHPSLRSGWASAWLRYEQARRGVGLGCTSVRYMTFDQKLGARHSGKRTPSRLVHTTCWMRRPVPLPVETSASGEDVGASCNRQRAGDTPMPAQDSTAPLCTVRLNLGTLQ